MRYRLFAIMFLVFVVHAVSYAENGKYALIITSFQVELNKYQMNLNDFYHEVNGEHPDLEFVVENMNCRSLSELNEWQGRMKEIIEKYVDRKPQLVLILGNEALASYLSINDDFVKTVPCFAMLVNDKIVEIMDEPVDIKTWQPKMRSLTTDMEECRLMGAVAYHYDIGKNVKLAQNLFPRMERMFFFVDNTFGGLNLLGLVEDWIKTGVNARKPDFRIVDGRSCTFENAGNIYSKMNPAKDIAMFSSWRIDATGNYFVISTTKKLLGYNSGIPGISISTTGIGDVSMGGYIPRYGSQGERIGKMVSRWLATGEPQKIELVENHYSFDYDLLGKWRIDKRRLPAGSEIINKPLSLYESNPLEFMLFFSVTVILVIIIVFLVLYTNTRRRNLERLKQVNAQLVEAKDKAEEADMLKSKFLANMSHEIRTPLNAIVGSSELIVTSYKELPEDEINNISGLIAQNTQLLLKLINDVLDFSRIESNRVQLNPERVELVGLARSLIQTETQSNLKNGVKLRFITSYEELWYMIDVRYLQQVIINLLNNAIKFTDEGTVTLELQKEKSEIVFSVTDTGIGIPLEKQKLVFRRFEKLDEFKQGTGLGLSICQTIIEKMGGRIFVDPEYRSGARFVFTLPLKK